MLTAVLVEYVFVINIVSLYLVLVLCCLFWWENVCSYLLKKEIKSYKELYTRQLIFSLHRLTVLTMNKPMAAVPSGEPESLPRLTNF